MNKIYLPALVFFSGMTVMGAEMAASRLIAPYFGTSLFVWTNLIGIVMIALTIGYYVGGRIADKTPKLSLLAYLLFGSGAYIALLPFLTKPIMRFSMSALDSGAAGAFYGSLAGTVLLIGLPMVMLGMTSPIAIRISAHNLKKVGTTSGNIYALGTMGSIFGTFLPALLTIPFLGTKNTFLLFGLMLMAISIPGMTKKWLMVVTILILPLWFVSPAIKFEHNVIDERESLYNYIQVVQYGKTNSLKLNEGHAIHSIYNPDVALTGGVWDYFSILPLEKDTERVLIIGLACGTISRTYNQFYPDIKVEGVEIDPEIIEVGKEYFGLSNQDIIIHVEDGRTFIDRSTKEFDIIIIDAYKQPYIPFHLTTREFFQSVHAHVGDGIAAINVGVTSDDSEVLKLITNTMASVFENVYVVRVPQTFNYVVIASDTELFTGESVKAPDVILSQLWRYAKESNKHLSYDSNSPILTDDKAPVEMYTDLMILDYALA